MKIGAKGWFIIHLQQVDPITIPVSCVLSRVTRWLLQMTGGVLLALSLALILTTEIIYHEHQKTQAFFDKKKFLTMKIFVLSGVGGSPYPLANKKPPSGGEDSLVKIFLYLLPINICAFALCCPLRACIMQPSKSFKISICKSLWCISAKVSFANDASIYRVEDLHMLSSNL
jgi:hypothetical protein